ncbi:MAG: hypothetical protein R2774_11170 [Saprospiraceae bacterium]
MLMEFGTVSIPEIGTFRLQKNKAQFSDNRLSVLPPKEVAIFDKHIDNHYLLKDLMVESGFDSEQSKALQNAMVHEVSDGLKVKGIYELPNLGAFNNDSFVFGENQNFNRYFNLSEIGVSPISLNERSGHHIEFAVPANGQSQVKRARTSMIWMIFPILLGLVSLLLLILRWTSPSIQENMHKTETHISVDPNVKSDFDTVPESNFLEDTEDGQNVVTDTSSLNLVHSTSSHNQDNSNEPCIIYVGTFEKVKNVERMIGNIKNKGYEPITEGYNNMTRVGIRYDCTNNTDSFKEVIRSKITKEAWTR